MKKSKKFSASKKPVVIFIYGPIAIGKLTVAKVLGKKLGWKVLHNHHINDFVEEVFDRGTYENNLMKEELRFYVLESAVKAKISFITTHAYAHDFVAKTGLSDPEYMQMLDKKLTKLGAHFYPVHLRARKKELLRRVSMSSRKQYGKIASKHLLQQISKERDWQTSPKIKSNLIIDNTNLSSGKAANMIIKYYKLKTK